MAAGKLKDSTNVVETDDELSELLEDEAEHKAQANGVHRPECELELGVELQVGDNQSWRVQESKQTNIKVEPVIVEGKIGMSI